MSSHPRQLQVPGPQQEAENQDRQEQPEPRVQGVVPVQGTVVY